MSPEKSQTRVYDSLLSIERERGGFFLLLVDPDRSSIAEVTPLVIAASECGVDALLIGTSFLLRPDFHASLGRIRELTTLPIVLFPGGAGQVSPHADAILFMSLVSGRNPNYLIDEQVRGAPFVKAAGLEPIPTAYMLIESGSYSSVEYVSGTRPIPRTKGDLAAAHALAAEMLGMKMIYLEAGSGARLSVPPDMIRDVRRETRLPIIVGGGIMSPDEAAGKINAGASGVVVGTRFESPQSAQLLAEFARACHPRQHGAKYVTITAVEGEGR